MINQVLRRFYLFGFCFFGFLSIAGAFVDDRLRNYRISEYQSFQNVAIGSMKEHEKRILGLSDRSFSLSQSSQLVNQLACQNFFMVFKDKQVIQIGIFFGYINEKIYALDILLAATVEKYLTSPCELNQQNFVCGFSPSVIDSGVFSKNVTWPDRTQRKVEVFIEFPALTILDTVNRRQPLAAQNKKSEAVRQAFIAALKTMDAVIYDGHVRYGGGPDFFPEKMRNADDGDDQYYKKNKAGLHDVLNALNARENGSLPFLVMNSCMSEQHIHGPLQKNQKPPMMAIVNNSLTTPSKGFPIYPEVLNIFLRGQCPFDQPLIEYFLLKRYKNEDSLKN
ncbi:MAG: hypothetical protein JNM39_11325 [Bdellovibrionaceae bacterium]|nr:hypothetical protein [Pseudobdellovibrionaceae bacterium]